MPEQVVIIGDFAKDLDDEHTLALAAGLQKLGYIELLAVIGNLYPAYDRAQVAKGTLIQCNLPNVPVGVGTAVTKDSNVYSYELDVPYKYDGELEDGQDLLRRTLKKAEDHSIILVLQSGMTDACLLLKNWPDLFQSKIKLVAIMGGVEVEDGRVVLDDAEFFVPDNSNNNTFDFESAEYLYKHVQFMGIPMSILTRNAAYGCQIPFSMYDDMEATGNPVGACLRGRQQPSLQKLWEAACSPSGSSIRGTLPDDRNREWLINVFCNGEDPGIEDGADIWPYVGMFNLYDPLNLVAAIPELQERFFNSHSVDIPGIPEGGMNTPVNSIIGLTPENNGIRDEAALRKLIMRTEVLGLTRN